jgi:hypothetical protein
MSFRSFVTRLSPSQKNGILVDVTTHWSRSVLAGGKQAGATVLERTTGESITK